MIKQYEAVMVAVDRLLTNRLKLHVCLFRLPGAVYYKIVIQSINRGLFYNKVCNAIIVCNFKLIFGLLVKLESNGLDFFFFAVFVLIVVFLQEHNYTV